jgi:hypothetical protein
VAITGTKAFTAGEVLTAANTNQYLMRGVKVFADAATRTAAYGGVGKPTLEEGEVTYLMDVDQVQVYDGASWRVIYPGATVATTIAGLGTGTAGRVGFLRLGTSPYDFLSLVYDATYAKWVSQVFPISGTTQNGLAGQVVARFGAAGWEQTGLAATTEPIIMPAAYLPHKAYTDSGLTLQQRLVGSFSASAGTMTITSHNYPQDAADTTLGADTAVIFANAVAQTADTVRDYGWQNVSPATPKAYLRTIVGMKNSAGVWTGRAEGTLWGRWVA